VRGGQILKKSNKKITGRKYGKFKYQVGSKIFYIGTLFEMYSNCEAEIISRSTSKSKIWYRVVFADGKTLQFVEHMLQSGEESGEDEREDVDNEN
jgi:hypothetical protein